MCSSIIIDDMYVMIAG